MAARHSISISFGLIMKHLPLEMTRVMRTLLKISCYGLMLLPSLAAAAPAEAPAAKPDSRPNILIIIADDLSYGSIGVAGGVAPDVTPNIDRLAKEGLQFTRAHVADPVCQPSRQSMFTGVYPHRYGSVDFWPMKKGTVTMSKLLREAGYVTGGFAKLHHMEPSDSFNFEIIDKDLNLGVPIDTLGRNPALLAKGLSSVINTAKGRNAPFMVVINAEDPHRPFHGDQAEANVFGAGLKTIPAPSRVYSAAEVTVPPTLPDLPRVREDLARYASSVRRLDDTVGACLKVLDESGTAKNTLVLFVSDNGMPLPFGKFETYVESSRTPLIVRWPGVIQAGKVDRDHLVSLIDVAPTLVEIGHAKPLATIDGRSLSPLLFGEASRVQWRDHLVTVRYEEIYYGEAVRKREKNSPGFIAQLEAEGWVLRPEHETPGTYSRPNNKRAVIDRDYVYIFNHWYDGTAKQAFPYGDPSYQAMAAAAKSDPALAERVKFYRYRSKEELYRYGEDPGYFQNLIGKKEEASRVDEARQRLARWMQQEDDPVRADFEKFLQSNSPQK